MSEKEEYQPWNVNSALTLNTENTKPRQNSKNNKSNIMKNRETQIKEKLNIQCK